MKKIKYRNVFRESVGNFCFSGFAGSLLKYKKKKNLEKI